MKHLRGGDGVEVLAGGKGLLHGPVVRRVGQHPQLDLGIVRVHQHPARRRGEAAADLGAVLPAHRQVLQVGVGGAEPPGGGHRLMEGGADAPVGVDGLGQALHIGAFQLADLAPFQDGGDDVVLFFQLFQGLGVGGPAGAGLFARPQAQLLKQHRSQLLGGANVEGVARKGVDLRLQLPHPLLQRGAEFQQPLLVGADAPGLHPGQHRQQGKLHVPHQRQHPQPLQLLLLPLPQGGNELHMLAQGLQRLLGYSQQVPGILGVVNGGQGVKAQYLPGGAHQVVIPPVDIQQIGAQPGVKDRVGGGGSFLIILCQKALSPVEHRAGAPQQGRLQKPLRGPLSRPVGAEGHRGAVRQHGGHHGAVGGHQHRLSGQAGQRLLQVVFGLQLPGGPFFKGGGRRGLRRRGQPQPLDDAPQLQPGEQGVQRPGIPRGGGQFSGTGGDRGVGDALCQVIAQEGHIPACLQLFPDGGGHFPILQVVIDPLQRAEPADQVQRALFPDAPDAGDVVGAVPHDGLQVHDAARGQAPVFFREHLLVVQLRGGLAHAGRHQGHPGLAGDILQAVPVAGDDGGDAPLAGAQAAQGTQQVVRLIALHLHPGDAQAVQGGLDQGHLVRQLLGHGLALGLVARIGLVAEGGGLQVEAHADLVGAVILPQLEQHIEEAVNGVGGGAVGGGQGPHTVKGPVHQAVSVDGHEMHGATSFVE